MFARLSGWLSSGVRSIWDELKRSGRTHCEVEVDDSLYLAFAAVPNCAVVVDHLVTLRNLCMGSWE